MDSGYFQEETFKGLKGKNLDIFIGECTFPTIGKAFRAGMTDHMDVNQCLRNLDHLYKMRAITDETEVYLTHIGPMATHEQLCSYFQGLSLPYRITVAYDGLTIHEKRQAAGDVGKGR